GGDARGAPGESRRARGAPRALRGPAADPREQGALRAERGRRAPAGSPAMMDRDFTTDRLVAAVRAVADDGAHPDASALEQSLERLASLLGGRGPGRGPLRGRVPPA